MKKARVINFGSLNVDHVYRVAALPLPGQTVLSESYERFCGGKGLNQSIALARAGAEVFHAGKVGHDGRRLIERLAEEGVNTSFIDVCESPTGHAVIFVDGTGQNMIMKFGGANLTMTGADAGRVLAHARAGDSVLVQNSISAAGDIIYEASKRGFNIFFNPAPFNEAVTSYPLEAVSCFIINEVEARQFSGSEDADLMLTKLSNRFPAAGVVITLGERGALYKDKKSRYAISGKQVEAVDSTAAGDTFIGYFVASVLSGIDVPASLDRANTAASVSVTRRGASDSIPHAHEVFST